MVIIVPTWDGVHDGSSPGLVMELGVSLSRVFTEDKGVPLLTTVAGETVDNACLLSKSPPGDSEWKSRSRLIDERFESTSILRFGLSAIKSKISICLVDEYRYSRNPVTEAETFFTTNCVKCRAIILQDVDGKRMI